MFRSRSDAGGKPVGEMLSWSGSKHMAGTAVTCLWPGLLRQHVPVPCLPTGTVPSQCQASVRWHGRGNGEGHLHVGFCWHAKKPHRKPSLMKGTCPQPAPVMRGDEGNPQGCQGGSNPHRALPAQRPGEWHRLKQGPIPGLPQVPQTRQEPYLPRQPKPLPSNLSPTRVHDLSILQTRDGSPSQRRAAPSSQAILTMLQPGPQGQVTGCSLSTHPHGAVGGDSRVITKNQPSPRAQEHRGLLYAPLQPLSLPLKQLIFPLLPLRRC